MEEVFGGYEELLVSVGPRHSCDRFLIREGERGREGEGERERERGGREGRREGGREEGREGGRERDNK